MKTRQVLNLTYLILILVAVNFLQGCTVWGSLIGHSIDKERYDGITISSEQFDTLMPGMKVRLLLDDSSTISGKILEIIPVDSVDYALQYEKCRNVLDTSIKLPELGDTLIMKSQFTDTKTRVTYGGQFKGALLGFSMGHLLMYEQSFGRTYSLPLERTTSMIEEDGPVYDPLAVLDLLMKGSIPDMSGMIAMELDHSVKVIPLEQVQQVIFHSTNNRGAKKGAGIGAILDVAVLVVIGLSWGGIGVSF